MNESGADAVYESCCWPLVAVFSVGLRRGYELITLELLLC